MLTGPRSYSKRTNQIFYCQLSLLAIAHSFLLVQEATLETCYCCVATTNKVQQCLPKLLPKPVESKVKKISVLIYVLLLNGNQF